MDALGWMASQERPRPLLAFVMGLTKSRAAALNQVPGMSATPWMLKVLGAETAVSKAYAHSQSADRRGLQIIGLWLMRYVGYSYQGSIL